MITIKLLQYHNTPNKIKIIILIAIKQDRTISSQMLSED